jgi:hypothetical protein
METISAINEALASLFKDKRQKQLIVEQLNNQPKYFKSVFEFSLLDDEPMAWRAAWLMRDCLVKNDERLSGKGLLLTKAIKGKTEGHQREILKNLDFISLEEDFEGYLFDACMTIWETLSCIPSTRMTAFKTMMRVAEKYPELKQDLKLLTEPEYTESLTPGIAATLRKELKKL